MMKMYAMNGMSMGDFGASEGQTLILNANHPLVQYVMDNKDAVPERSRALPKWRLRLLTS